MVCFDGWSLYVTRSEACQVCTHPCKNIQVQEKKLCLWRAQRGKVCTLLGSKLTVQFFFSRQQSTRSTHGFENRPEPSVWSLSSLCVCVWLDFLNEKRERGHGDAVATFLCLVLLPVGAAVFPTVQRWSAWWVQVFWQLYFVSGFACISVQSVSPLNP